MAKTAVGTCAAMSVALTVACADAGARQLVPPAGYSGPAGPGVAIPTEAGAPKFRRIPDASLLSVFRIDAAYARKTAAEKAAAPEDLSAISPPSRAKAVGRVKVVGAFAIVERSGTHLVAAWAAGFLPVTLSFSDRRCFSLAADYIGGTLSNGRLNRVACTRRTAVDEPPPPPPSDHALRLVGSTWGLHAWADVKRGKTIVTKPHAKTFEPLFITDMRVISACAMNGIDYAGGNITLMGWIKGRLMVVTLEYSY